MLMQAENRLSEAMVQQKRGRMASVLGRDEISFLQDFEPPQGNVP